MKKKKVTSRAAVEGAYLTSAGQRKGNGGGNVTGGAEPPRVVNTTERNSGASDEKTTRFQQKRFVGGVGGPRNWQGIQSVQGQDLGAQKEKKELE